jgi:hypothetical protein
MKSSVLPMLALLLAACTDGKPVDDTGSSTEDLDGDGYSVGQGDCDDADAAVFPGAVEAWYDAVDQDCDGNDSDQDEDGTPVGDDCDDTDPAVNPDAQEVCDDVDNDCDGSVDVGASDSAVAYLDADGDGHGTAGSELDYCGAVPDGYSDRADDCDDGERTVYPGAEEICDDLDNDCDGEVNEGNPDQVPYYADGDGDGFGDASDAVLACQTPDGYTADNTDCSDADATIYPGADEFCDDVDSDCDGQTQNDPVDGTVYYADVDLDGYGDDGTGVAACAGNDGEVVLGGDCDDTSAATNPAAVEACDGIDNDCAGGADDGLTFSDWYADADVDGYGDATAALSACAQPDGYVSDASDCDDTDALSYPAATEVCDLEDNDCDGTVDDGAVDERTYYDDGDSDGYGTPSVTVSACGLPSGYAETGDDCDDANSRINPGRDETCNGLDDDCSTVVDDDPIDGTRYYADGDGDTYGDASTTQLSCDPVAGWVSDASDCDDGRAEDNPAAAEVCDGRDNNCDLTVDEATAVDASVWYNDGDSDGYGDPLTTSSACSAPSGYVANDGDCDDASALVEPGAAEQCNGTDDDCDGATDEAGSLGETVWYLDGDLDGYGVSTASITACDVPSGYASGTDDCDDTDGTVNPGAAEADDLVDDDCDGWVDEDFVAVGDVIVSEVTRLPRFGTAAAVPDGQWFELYNTSTRDVDLSNWYISRTTSTVARTGVYVDPADGVILGAGEYAVFCKTDTYAAVSTSSSTLVCDYIVGDEAEASTYVGTYHDNTFELQRDDDDLQVYVGGDYVSGTLVDSVHWTWSSIYGYWPRDATRSLVLDPLHLDGVDNDDEANWCSNSTSRTYRWYVSVSGDYGTPGSANYDCP